MDPSEPIAESSTRPSRRTATKKRKSDTDATGGSVPKRARTTKKKTGKLATLLQISLDVVFEIFGNLQPLDLLRVSRLSKEFRALLMHKSSISIWRSALSNVPDLPSCPPNMNEPQWINLVFDAICHVCGKISRKVDWGLYVRVCTKCSKTHLSSRFHIPALEDAQTVLFHELVPKRPDYIKRFKTVCFIPALDKIKTVYTAIESPDERTKFVQERKELVKTLAEHTKLCEAWAEGVAENRSTEIADLKAERCTAIVAKLTALGWGTEIDSIQPMDSLKSHKHVKQPHRLTERMWETIEPEMVAYMELMKTKRLAREHAALVIQRKAIATKVFRTFKRSQLPWSDVMPGHSDFWDFPEIKAALMEPSEVVVDEQTFEALLPAFPRMIATWREGLVKDMVKLYKRSNKDTTLEDDKIETQLKLATCVFKCTTCGDDDSDSYFGDIMFELGHGSSARCRPLYWPRVLAHRCLTRTPFYMAMLMFQDAGQTVPWRTHPLAIDTRVAGIVEKIVEACGLDPATTTAEDMDAADPRLVCLRCAERDEPDSPGSDAVVPGLDADIAGQSASGAGIAEGSCSATTAKAKANDSGTTAWAGAFSWRNAVRHEGETHYRGATVWHMLGDAEAALARAKEAVMIAEARQDGQDDIGQQATTDSDEPMPDAEAATQDNDGAGAVTPVPQEGEDTDADVDDGPDVTRILPSGIPELVWSCAHCLDSAREKPATTRVDVLNHLATVHDVLGGTAKLNDDYYRTLAAPEVYTTEHFPQVSLRVEGLPPAPPPVPRASHFGFNPLAAFDLDYGDYDEFDDYAFPW